MPQASHEAEFGAFFERHHRELSRLAYLVTGDHGAADEVTGDALAAAWQHWSRVRSSDVPLAYVRRMVLNLAASRVRKLVRERRGLHALGQVRQSEGESGPDGAAVLDVRAALAALPPRRRACVVLRLAFDLSEEEVARTLRISVGTVKSQTSKGVAALRGLLGEPAESSGSAERREWAL